MNIFMYHRLTIIPCGLVHPDLKVLGFLPVIYSFWMSPYALFSFTTLGARVVSRVIKTGLGQSRSHLWHFRKNLNRLCIAMPRLVPLRKNETRGTQLVTETKKLQNLMALRDLKEFLENSCGNMGHFNYDFSILSDWQIESPNQCKISWRFWIQRSF